MKVSQLLEFAKSPQTASRLERRVARAAAPVENDDAGRR